MALNTYRSTWWVASLDGAAPPRQIADGGEAVWSSYGLIETEMPQWSADSHFVYFRAFIDGAVQVWRASRDGTVAEAVTRDLADVAAFHLTADGQTLVYTVGAAREEIRRAEDQEYDQGVLIDASIDPAQNLYRGAIIRGRPASQRLSGRWFARTGLLDGRPTITKAIDLKTLGEAPAPSEAMAAVAPEASGGVSVRSPDGARVASATWDGAKGALSVSPQGSKPAMACLAPICQGQKIVALAWRPDSRTLVFTTMGADRRQALNLWNLDSGRARTLILGDGLLNGGGPTATPCVVGARTVVCVAASAAAPPRLLAVDLSSGAAKTVANPNADLAQAARMPVQTLAWNAAGHAFSGKLFLPADAKGPAPLFITYYHCDGYLRGGVGDEWPLAPLAAAGIAALCIDVTPQPPGPQDAVANYEAALAGIAKVIDILQARDLIDPRRVGMGGLSFGSEAAMWVAMNSNLLSCLSIASPQVTPVYYWFNGFSQRDNHATLKAVWGLGAPDETPERWRRLSPALNIDALKAPILMQMPEQEFRWDMDFIAKLSVSTTPSELYVFPNEPHIKVIPRHKLAAYQRNLDWFRFWLQGFVDPDPLKVEQYRRWSAKAAAAGLKPPSATAPQPSTTLPKPRLQPIATGGKS